MRCPITFKYTTPQKTDTGIFTSRKYRNLSFYPDDQVFFSILVLSFSLQKPRINVALQREANKDATLILTSYFSSPKSSKTSNSHCFDVTCNYRNKNIVTTVTYCDLLVHGLRSLPEY
jgi:hypothetical protein